MNSLADFLFKAIQFLPGVGPKLSGVFGNIGIKTVWDLIAHLPQAYEEFPLLSLPELANRKGAIVVEIVNRSPGRRFPVHIMAQASNNCGLNFLLNKNQLEIIFFHTSYYIKQLVPGSKWILKGEITCRNSVYQMAHPQEIIPFKQGCLWNMHQAGYALTKGITLKTVSNGLKKCWPIIEKFAVKEWIAKPIIEKYAWPGWKEALYTAHHPTSSADIALSMPWRERLAFDELIAQQLAFLKEKKYYDQLCAPACKESQYLVSELLQRFGHSLTQSQQNTWKTVSQDLRNTMPMRRMIHGEVGSGKTILAFLAALQVVEAGFQAAFLAPTEILARQHFDILTELLHGIPIKVELLLGKQKKNYEAIRSGVAHIAIGTHALFQDKVEFSNLALVIIDEQQRFGVQQRLSLMQKGKAPHLLLLSATPIPRTFEMALWGNLNVSLLTERTCVGTVSTYIFSAKKIAELEQWMAEQIAKKARIYWVCPLIEEENNNQEGSVFYRLKRLYESFGENVGYLHGKMHAKEKQKIMERFRSGEVPILVSTTVIEVGVHVKEATTMVIEKSECFGLSQLHQLRGRVGRGALPGHCFLIYTQPLSAHGRERLKVLRESNDGFYIAEKDWKLRGGGDRVGTQQSGFYCYRFADLTAHASLIDDARKEAERLWEDPSCNDQVAFLLRLFSWHHPGIFLAG